MAKIDGKRGALKGERLIIGAGVAVLAAVSILPFLPGLAGPFMFDDFNSITQNPAVHSFDLKRSFTDPSAFSVKPGNWPYRPVTLIVNAINYQIAELDPIGWRLVTLFIHAVNSILVAAAARTVFGLKKGAFMAGALFGCAAIQSESVLYASARSMVISMTPALLALIVLSLALKMAGKKLVAGLLAVSLLCVIAFNASEGSLAVVAWSAIAVWVGGYSFKDKRAVIGLAILAALAAGFVALRVHLTSGLTFKPHPGVAPSYNFTQHALLQLRTPFVMAKLALFPKGLSFIHHAPAPETWSLFTATTIIALVLTAFILYYFRRYKAPVAGLAWYFASLLPAVLVPLNVAWAEHRSYLALPGLFIALAWIAEKILYSGPSYKRYFIFLMAACLVFMCLSSGLRASKYSNDRDIFADAAMKSPGDPAAWNFLAERDYRAGAYARAAGYLEVSISLSPGFADAYNTRAACLMRLGRLPEAAQSAREAVRLAPEVATYWSTLAVILMMDERLDEAEAVLNRAISSLRPDDPNRAIILRNREKLARLKSQSR